MANLMRTFIAIDLPPGISRRIEDIQTELSQHGHELKWVEQENLHLTLLFLGEVDLLTIPRVCRIVKAEAKDRSPFVVTVEGVGAFPNLRRPKVIWAGVSEGREVLQSLHEGIEGPLLDLGCYRREEREYTPHVTIGRLTAECDAEAVGQYLSHYEDWQGGQVMVREILIMGSELRRSGPVYTIMGRAPCGGIERDDDIE